MISGILTYHLTIVCDQTLLGQGECLPLLELTEADQLLRILVPESVGHAFETRQQAHGWHVTKQLMRIMAAFQVVVRNA